MSASIESVVRFGTWIAAWIGRGVVALKDLGPYAAIELVLPGGSVLALLLWLYQRHRKSASTGSASIQCARASMARGRRRQRRYAKPTPLRNKTTNTIASNRIATGCSAPARTAQ
jgi:hypothetical protein